MTSQAFTDWLTVIVSEDDPANGGAGILTRGSCPKCDGIGVVENVGTRNGWPRIESCEKCEGTGWNRHDAR
jgi:DnaJ-class molecular chaperone